MAEMMEKKEIAEQPMPDPEKQQQIEEYLQQSIEAIKTGASDMARYYESKAVELGFRRKDNPEYVEDFNRERSHYRAMERIQQAGERWIRSTPNYGTPETESGWKDAAAKEYEENGESAYYKMCMREAAKCHVNNG